MAQTCVRVVREGEVASSGGSGDDGGAAEHCKAGPAVLWQHLRNQASQLAKVSIRFEQQSHDKGKAAPELPRDMCRTVSLVTQEMAEYIALKADVWAIEQMVHGAQEDQTYDDSTVEQRRERVFQNFMDLVMEVH